MRNDSNPFAENGFEENLTMIITATFRIVLDKAIKGYCPYAKIDTFFVSEEEAKHFSWSNGLEVGVQRLDLSGKQKDFVGSCRICDSC